MSDFNQLDITHKALDLAVGVYRITGAFPATERYGLSAQLRSAVVSIGSNVAEGTGRGTPRDFLRFVDMAVGSSHEVQYQLLLARDLGYLSAPTWKDLDAATTELQRMLSGLRGYLRHHAQSPSNQQLVTRN